LSSILFQLFWYEWQFNITALMSRLIVIIIEFIYYIILFIKDSFFFIWVQSIIGAFHIFPILWTCTLLLYYHSYQNYQFFRFYCDTNTSLKKFSNLLLKNQAAIYGLSTIFCYCYLANSISFSMFSLFNIRLCNLD